jgi:glycosyltransferase involved in cell wall biosynthesis
LEQWLPHCQAQGIRMDLVPFADRTLQRLLYQPGQWLGKAASLAAAFGRRVADLASVRNYDAIVVHRAACLAGPPVMERALNWSRRPIIFDFDDAIYLLNTSPANRRFGWLKFPGKTASLCRLSQHVVAGNAVLAAYARQYNPRVTIIPSSVDTDHFRPLPPSAARRRVVIGWTGSSTSQDYLEAFAPALRPFLSRPEVEFRVHSDRPPQLPGIPFVWRPWSARTEPEELACFDVGIMPLPDSPWARGKCAMKALLYMAMGIPAVCAPVGANCEVIHHGENGLLAATDADWLSSLEALVADRRLRQRLGAAGRQTVEERYSMRGCAAAFARVIRETLSCPRVRPQ